MTTRIIGTGSAIPETIVTNDELSHIVETSDEWILSRTGIQKRRIAKQETTVSLAADAGRAALKNSGIEAAELDLIIVSTCSPDSFVPCTACEVQKALGAQRAAAFDLNAACSGFLFALNTAHSYIKSGFYENALIIGAETLSKLVDWKERSTCVLFGDGAGAAVVQKNALGIIDMIQKSDGEIGDALTCQARKVQNIFIQQEEVMDYITMDGQAIFRFALTRVPECILELLEKNRIDKSEIKYFVLHQANRRIIQSVAKRLKIEEEKIPVNLDIYGNTSAASIPILLDEMNRKGMLQKGDKIVLSGFGGGLTWGATLIEW